MDSISELMCGASLAHHGLLGSVKEVVLLDVDLTSVPTEHLASLVSSVAEYVSIKNILGGDLITILDSVKSKEVLSITRQSLGSDETRALVCAMESRVELVMLNHELTLDIKALMEYSGQGNCGGVWCYSDTAARYREQLRTWATGRNWEVICVYDNSFRIARFL